MRKVFFVFITWIAVLSAAPDASWASQIHLLAPAEESFVGMDRILFIGKLTNGVNAGRIDFTDNGKALGSAPVLENTFVFRAALDEGLNDIVLSIPGGETRTVKVFVGKQTGYRYHIQTNNDSCADCHAEAAGHLYSLGAMQTEICSKCHEPLGVFEYVHGPVAAGSCTPCHDPHGSNHRRFLVATGRELCITCHDQNYSKGHIDNVQNAQCLRCHDPHGSSKRYHLN